MSADPTAPARPLTPTPLDGALDIVFDALERSSEEALLFFGADAARMRACERALEVFDTLPDDLTSLFSRMGYDEGTHRATPFGARVRLDERIPCSVQVRGMELAGAHVGTLVRVRFISSQLPWGVEELFGATPIGVLIFKGSDEVVYANHEASRLFACSTPTCAKCLDARARLLRPNGTALTRAEHPFWRVLGGGELAHSEIHALTHESGEEFWVTIDVVEVEGERSCWVALVRDVTAQHAREASRDELISIASHELRNPLTPLVGLLQMAVHQRERDERVDEVLLRKAEHQVQRLTGLVDGLLDLSRVESGRLVPELERVDLSKVVRVHVASLASGRVRTNRVDGPVWVRGWAPALEQIVSNLVQNALKFSEDHEHVTVCVVSSPDRVTLSVRDNGPGIPADEISRIFERFYRSPEARRVAGLGLGLYITRRLVEEHEGHIDVDSEQGVGTVVEVVLPKFM